MGRLRKRVPDTAREPRIFFKASPGLGHQENETEMSIACRYFGYGQNDWRLRGAGCGRWHLAARIMQLKPTKFNGTCREQRQAAVRGMRGRYENAYAFPRGDYRRCRCSFRSAARLAMWRLGSSSFARILLARPATRRWGSLGTGEGLAGPWQAGMIKSFCGLARARKC
jgi:hypothetical protein